jgi:D-glycero-alpha-D-manno-heptose 1-phosphate guanylyltransferase
MARVMEAIILAGGLGTRLRHIVRELPKPMAPVAGRPFLEILLASLAQKGFTRVVLSLGYMADKVVKNFGKKFSGMDLIYEIETSPLGTGGAIRQALLQCREDHVYVLNGDTYLDAEMAEIESFWQSRRTPIIVARTVPNTARYGRIHSVDGRLLAIGEKNSAGPGLINAGLYVLPRDVLDSFSGAENFSFENDFLAQKVTESRFDVFVTRGYFIDIGVPEDYFRAQTELAHL